MTAMEILWNRNYCVESLDEMIRYFGKSEKIPARNLIILLFSIDIITVPWLWSILHIAIVIPMSWFATYTHNMKEHGWGYISIGKVLDKLKEELNMIVDKPELIHKKSFMMGMMDPWEVEFSPFQEYLDHKLKQQKTNYFNLTSTTK